MNLLKNTKIRSIATIVLISFFMLGLLSVTAMAQDTGDIAIPSVNLSFGGAEDGEDVVGSIQILALLTIVSLAPSILVMMTSFTRIIIVLRFVRSALSTQQTPPNQLLIGLALFLTVFIMAPVIEEVNDEALQPYSEGVIGQEEAIERGMAPLRDFMFGEVNPKDLVLFMDIAQVDTTDITAEGLDDGTLRGAIPTEVLIPAFIISELRAAFIIGFLIYVPFIVIDMVVASTLMSMGMMMLPPVMISMPFKLLIFIMADGWNLIIGELVKTFYD